MAYRGTKTLRDGSSGWKEYVCVWVHCVNLYSFVAYLYVINQLRPIEGRIEVIAYITEREREERTRK